MKYVVSAAIVAVVLAVLTIVGWVNDEIGAFNERCHDAGGGETRRYGTAMSSWVCLTPGGRILVDVEGPGL